MNLAERRAAETQLATLSPDMTDEDLRAVLDRSPGVLDLAQSEATQQYRQARTAPGALGWTLDQDWRAFQLRTRQAVAAPGTNARSPADFAARVAQLRVALEARAHFRAHLKMSPVEREMAERQERARRFVQRETTIANAAAAGTPWSAAVFVAHLGRQGIVLGADAEGGIIARPASLLTAGDRAMIAAHRAQIVAFLSDSERVA